MSEEGADYFSEIWNRIPDECLKFHIPYNKLCNHCLSLSQHLKQESEIQNKSYETRFHQTLEAALKLYQDCSGFETWENFKKVADMLAEMHRGAKRRINHEFASGYYSGAANFSRDFLRQIGQLYSKDDISSHAMLLQPRILEPILRAPSDPPLGVFKPHRQVLRPNRRNLRRQLSEDGLQHSSSRPLSSSSSSSSSSEDDSSTLHLSPSARFPDVSEVSSVNLSTCKRSRLIPQPFPGHSPSESSCSAGSGSYLVSNCSNFSDEKSTDESTRHSYQDACDADSSFLCSPDCLSCEKCKSFSDRDTD